MTWSVVWRWTPASRFVYYLMIRRLKTLILVTAVLAASIGADGQQTDRDRGRLKLLQPALDAIQSDTIFNHIKNLASDEFEGRGPGTRGETLTVDYLVDQFKRAGAKPG